MKQSAVKVWAEIAIVLFIMTIAYFLGYMRGWYQGWQDVNEVYLQSGAKK